MVSWEGMNWLLWLGLALLVGVGCGEFYGSWEGMLIGGKEAGRSCGGEAGVDSRDNGSFDGFRVVRVGGMEVPGRRDTEIREVFGYVEGHCGL